MTRDRPNSWRIAFTLGILGVVATAPSTAHASGTDSGDMPLDVVAASVRDRGFDCDDPKKAERDEAASKPDEAAWVIDCGNAHYRVTYKGDTGVEVEELD